MSWLKEVIVDIAVSVFIVASALYGLLWMQWIVWIYTGIMLLTKGIVLMGDNVLQLMSKTRTNAPEWFSHLLYAINTGVLFYIGWWYAATGWALIWLFSFLAQRRLKKQYA